MIACFFEGKNRTLSNLISIANYFFLFILGTPNIRFANSVSFIHKFYFLLNCFIHETAKIWGWRINSVHKMFFSTSIATLFSSPQQIALNSINILLLYFLSAFINFLPHLFYLPQKNWQLESIDQKYGKNIRRKKCGEHK